MRGLVRRTSKRSSIPTSPTSPSSSSSRGSKTYQHGSHGRNLSAPTIQVPKASTASSISAASTSSTPQPEGSANDHLPMDLATHIALESRDMETGKPPASVLSDQAVGLPSPALRKSWGDDGSAEGGTMSPTGMLSSSGEARMAPRSSVIRVSANTRRILLGTVTADDLTCDVQYCYVVKNWRVGVSHPGIQIGLARGPPNCQKPICIGSISENDSRPHIRCDRSCREAGPLC